MSPRVRRFAWLRGLARPRLIAACLLLSLTPAAAQRPGDTNRAPEAVRADEPPAKKRSESDVAGRVVYDDTGRPVRRARVTLVPADGGAAAAVDEGDAEARIVEVKRRYAGTGRDGEFRIRGVEPGRYFVVVDSPGVISPLLLADDEDDFARLASAGRAERRDFGEVTVDGRSDARVELKARRGGVVTGRVTYADGQPLAAAPVVLYRLRAGVLTELSSGGRTDARGVYRVAGLPAGEYLVRVEEATFERRAGGADAERGYASGALVFAYHPDTASLKEARAVRVETARESADVDVRLPARATHAVSGTVVSRRGNRPLRYVKLTLELDEEGYDDSMPTTSMDVMVDEEGRFRIGGVPDGNYTLTAARQPASEGSGEGAELRYYVSARQELKVEGADVSDVSFRLAEGTTVSGVVVVEGRARRPEEFRLTAYTEEDKSGRTPAAPPGQAEAGPAPEAAPTPMPLLTGDDVYWMLTGEETHVHDEYDAETGKFEINGVEPGEVSLHVLAIEGFYVKSVTRGGVDLLSTPLEVAEGERVTGVRVTLARGATAVSGRVLGRGGASAGETDVALIPVNPARRRVLEATYSAATGADGRYEIHAPPGEYYVFTRPTKEHLYLRVTEEDVRARAATLPRVILRPGERRTLDVKTGEKN